MEAHIDTITLGVADLEASVVFYRDGLGLETDGIIGTEFEGSDTEPAGRVAMFRLRNDLLLSLYPIAELAKDAGRDVDAITGHGFSIGHTVDTRDQVDRLLAAAAAAGGWAGGTHERPWGIYAGYFRDPDGHLWEVVCFLDRPCP